MAGLFLKTRGDSAVILEPAKHAFDDMALLVQIPVAISLYFTIGFGRDHRCN